MIGLGPLAPYKLALQFGLLGVLLLIALRGGCAWQSKLDHAKIDRLETKVEQHKAARNQAARDLKAAGDRFRAISAAAENARRLAEAAKRANAEEVKLAKQRADKFLAERNAFERTINDAKRRSPSCRVQMEAPLCVPIQ